MQKFTSILKVRTSSVWHFRTSSLPPLIIVCNQGFAAEIPETYLLTLQSNLQQPDSLIDYIGKADAI